MLGGGGDAAAPVAGAGPRRGLLLAAVTLSVAAGFIDLTAVGVALPSIQRDFDVSTTTAHWIVLSFLLTSASLVAAAGRFADIFGRRRIYLVGLGVFTLGSVVCSGVVIAPLCQDHRRARRCL